MFDQERPDTKQHDAVLDYYGRRLATCSSDRTIKIFEIEGETQRLTETLKGYAGVIHSRGYQRVPILIIETGTMARYGASHGRTQNTATFWRARATTGRC
jgi:hypothetical protein